MGQQFPVAFNFQAFENISSRIDKINGKFADLQSKVQGVNNRFYILQQGTKKWREGLSSVGDSITGVGKKMSLFATAPLAALATKFVHTSIEAEETASKFNAVFDEVSEAARNAAINDLKNRFDLSTQSAQEMAATTGLLAQDLGLTGKQSLKMASDVTALGVQMAAFRNIQGGAEAATETLRAAMLGQTKGLAKLGLKITDAQIKTEAQTLANKGLRFATVEQAKALAILSLVQKRTTKDQADFKDSSEEMENQLRVAQERFKEVSKQLGDILKPAFASVLSVVNRALAAFRDLSPGGKKLVVIFGALVAAVGPLLVGLGFFVGTVMPALISGLSLVAAMFGAITLPVLGVVAAVGALIGIGVLLVTHWEEVKAFFAALWDGPAGRLARFVGQFLPFIAIPKLIMENWEPIKEFFTDLFSFIGKGVMGFLKIFQPLAEGIGRLGQLALFGRGGKFGIPEVSQEQALGIGGKQATEKGDMRAQAQEIGQTIAKETRTVNDARVRVDFANAPRGTQVSSQATGLPPTLNLGMMGAPL